MLCIRCGIFKAQYTVIAPVCLRSVKARFCPTCFQDGLDHGEIAWLGDEAYGICQDHEEEDVA